MDRRTAITQGSIAFGMISQLRVALAQYQPVNLGVLPHVNARAIALQYEPMQQFLSHKLDARVMVSTSPDWGSFYRNAKNGDYDIVVAAVNVARLMQIDLGLIPVASYHPKIQGLVVTHKHFAAQSIRSKLGTRIAISNPASLIAFEAQNWFENQGLRAGLDFQFTNVKGETSIGMLVAQQEASAGIMSSYGFHAQSQDIKTQLQIHKTFTEAPSFVVLASRQFSEGLGKNLARSFEEFSDTSVEGKRFTERTGFKILNQVNDRDLIAMDAYLEKTKRLIG
jgi:phosphonate transport system substrate-binding protein